MLSTKSRFPLSQDVQELIQKREAWKHTGYATFLLAYGALGIVFGDIGTSPLYAMAGIFSSFDPTPQDILGAVSMIFWSITLIVLLKYVFIVLQAHDHGEGGTFALYTRLCRILGIATINNMDKSVHEDVLKTAAVAGRIRDATNLSRNTRSLAKVLSSNSRAQYSSQLEAEVDAAAAAEMASSCPCLKKDLIHRWAFPAAPIKRFFQGAVGARAALLGISVLATSMVIGDGVLTPAVSVLSAVQGLTFKTPISQEGIMGITIAILVVLFTAQSFGTHRIAFLFSPIIVLWMLSILGVGIYNLVVNGGEVLQGLGPQHIVIFFSDNGTLAWKSLGGVMLCLTGCEALFADLGHFSIGAIAFSFSLFVYPCVIFAYLGQGAHLLQNLDDVGSAFWATVPDAFVWPMLVISTLAAVVASQAMISGAFSIVRQATTLGCFPSLRVRHTGEEVEGQVYIGTINYVLMVLCVAVVAGFGGDGVKIGNAYGIAVAFVMLITTLLILLVMLVDWEISALFVVPFAAVYLLLEGGLLSANLIKVPEGGWFAILVSSVFAAVMFIWMSGQSAKSKALEDAKHSASASVADLLLSSEHAATPPGPAAGAAAARYQPPGLTTGAEPVAELPAAQVAKALAVRSTGLAGSLATRSRRLGTDLQPSLASSSATFFNPLTAAQSEGLPPMPVGQHAVEVAPEPAVGLAKLRGMGIYFTASRRGMPPVMWHFLRNVEAVHEVVVLLHNQIIPVPYLSSLPGIDVSHRFGGCIPVPGVPHMYQVVARYGYMDVVDNGPEFAAAVREYIKQTVCTQALVATEAAGQAAEEVKLLDSAFEQGVVYYLGKTRLRMKKMSNMLVQIVHDVWYGDLYRLLHINAWDKVDTWNVPSTSMVEVSLGVDI